MCECVFGVRTLYPQVVHVRPGNQGVHADDMGACKGMRIEGVSKVGVYGVCRVCT